jgi:hypothetical protein
LFCQSSKFTINYQDRDGNTALHYCAIYNRVEATKLLLKANAKITLRNKMGHTALEIAYNLQHLDLVKQVNLFIQGKPVDKIDLICLYDRDYMSDSGDELQNQSPARPSSMMSLSNDEFVDDEHHVNDGNNNHMAYQNQHNKTSVHVAATDPYKFGHEKIISYVPPKGSVKVLPDFK